MAAFSLQAQAALKAKGLRDDITVLVVDTLPDEACRLPPHLAKNNGGPAPTLEEVGSLDWHRPLEVRGCRSLPEQHLVSIALYICSTDTTCVLHCAHRHHYHDACLCLTLCCLIVYHLLEEMLSM